jgi:hypothetical protein
VEGKDDRAARKKPENWLGGETDELELTFVIDLRKSRFLAPEKRRSE